MKIKLSDAQIKYVMAKVAMPEKQKALEYFASLLVMERIDPRKMPIYVHLMMTKDGVR